MVVAVTVLLVIIATPGCAPSPTDPVSRHTNYNIAGRRGGPTDLRSAHAGHRHRFHGADRVETSLEFTQASEDDPEGQPELEVLLVVSDGVPSERTGARRSPPAEELDVPGADRLATEPRRESASHGLKVRG
jgi:hypothetical protein